MSNSSESNLKRASEHVGAEAISAGDTVDTRSTDTSLNGSSAAAESLGTKEAAGTNSEPASSLDLMKGTVKWFNDAKGFGFIEHASGRDVFVHYSVIETEGFKTLKDGESVLYSLAEGNKGLHAGRVVRDPSMARTAPKQKIQAGQSQTIPTYGVAGTADGAGLAGQLEINRVIERSSQTTALQTIADQTHAEDAAVAPRSARNS